MFQESSHRCSAPCNTLSDPLKKLGVNVPDERTLHRVHVLMPTKDSNKSRTCMFYKIVIDAETPVDESVSSSDLYKPPLYRSTPVSRVGIVGCLRAYLILYCNNFRVHQIRCYHPGSHLPFYEGGIVFYSLS